MRRSYIPVFLFLILGVLAGSSTALGQTQKAKSKKATAFRWVNPLSEKEIARYPSVTHATFESTSLEEKVGYCIYLPPQYAEPQWRTRQFPVVYYLHGGRPGSEKKSLKLTEVIHQQIQSGAVPPMIYVFVNGGPVSHYNVPSDPAVRGADIFINELIPHIDSTYRTIPRREGRALEGFSQGGRGTARLMFRYPELFCCASPGGGGHATEKRISEEGGAESPELVFAEGDNTWDLATTYAERLRKKECPQVDILVHVGDQGFNYANNLDWMKHLRELDIQHESLIVAGAEHSALQIYEKVGKRIMLFHATHFKSPVKER